LVKLSNFLLHSREEAFETFKFLVSDYSVGLVKLCSNFLDFNNSKVASSYMFPFYHLEAHHFSILKNFLYEFVDSPIGKHREHSFYLFLAKCSKEFPKECIHLASKFKNHIDFNTKDQVLRNEPLNVIISAYNQIREYDKSDSSVEKAMDVFDSILKSSKFRDSAFDVLDKLEY